MTRLCEINDQIERPECRQSLSAWRPEYQCTIHPAACQFASYQGATVGVQ
jgi:hypothetical protein